MHKLFIIAHCCFLRRVTNFLLGLYTADEWYVSFYAYFRWLVTCVRYYLLTIQELSAARLFVWVGSFSEKVNLFAWNTPSMGSILKLGGSGGMLPQGNFLKTIGLFSDKVIQNQGQLYWCYCKVHCYTIYCA